MFKLINMNKEAFVLELFNKYPDKYWDMEKITEYTYILHGIDGIEKLLDEHKDIMKHVGFVIDEIYSELTEKILEKHIDMRWDWIAISMGNKNISFEFYEKHIDKDFSHLAVFNMIDDTLPDERIISFLLNIADKTEDHWIVEISKMKIITSKIVEATTPQYKWCWHIILNRSDMIFPVEFFIENYSIFKTKWAFVEVYMKSNKITIDFIEKLLEKYPEMFRRVIYAKCITLDFVIKHKKNIKNWDYQSLYQNGIVTFDYLERCVF